MSNKLQKYLVVHRVITTAKNGQDAKQSVRLDPGLSENGKGWATFEVKSDDGILIAEKLVRRGMLTPYTQSREKELIAQYIARNSGVAPENTVADLEAKNAALQAQLDVMTAEASG